MAPTQLSQFPSEKSKILWTSWVEKYKKSQDDGRWNEYDVTSNPTIEMGGTQYSIREVTLDKYSSIYDEVKRYAEQTANSDWFKEWYKDENDKWKTRKVDMKQIYPEVQPLELLTKLQYTRKVIGEPPASGYPVYIAMHGGGGADEPVSGQKTFKDTFRDRDIENRREWSNMTLGYKNNLENGVWIALRGIGDSWDMHFSRAGYVLIERLIDNMALFGIRDDAGRYRPIDTNRVYLIGFSAGGDGVYRLGMHLPQRFAAVNMGAGHPGDVKFTNSLNLPTCLQVGEQDTSFGGRSKTAAESARTIDHLRLDARAWLNDAAAPVYINSCYIHPTAPDPINANAGDLDLYIHRHFMWEDPYFWSKDSSSPRPLSTIIKSRYAWLQAFDALAIKGSFLDIDTLTKEGKGPALDSIRQTILLNTNPIDWLNNKNYIRNPIPANIIWDLYSDRIFGPNSSNDNFVPAVYNNTSGLFQFSNSKNFWGRKQFFWLDIGTAPPPSGILLPIKVRLNTNENKIMIDQLPLRYLRILLRPEMLAQPGSPVTIVMPSGEVLPPVMPNWDNTDVIWDTMMRNDPNFIFNADVVVSQDQGGKWTAASTPFPAAK